MEAQLKLNAWLAFFYYKNVKNTINCCLFYEALPPFRHDNVRFATRKRCLINCTQLISIVRYHFYNFQNRFNSTVVSLQSDSRQFYWRTHIEIIRLVEKRQYLPHFLSDVGIKGIVVNRTLPSLNGVSLETILPNPLKTREKNLTCMYLVSKLLKDFFYSQIDVVQKDLSK